jgi:hypothetical protein
MAAAARLRLEVERFQELVLGEGLARIEALDRIAAERPSAAPARPGSMRESLDPFERPGPERAP